MTTARTNPRLVRIVGLLYALMLLLAGVALTVIQGVPA